MSTPQLIGSGIRSVTRNQHSTTKTIGSFEFLTSPSYYRLVQSAVERVAFTYNPMYVILWRRLSNTRCILYLSKDVVTRIFALNFSLQNFAEWFLALRVDINWSKKRQKQILRSLHFFVNKMGTLRFSRMGWIWESCKTLQKKSSFFRIVVRPSRQNQNTGTILPHSSYDSTWGKIFSVRVERTSE